MKITVDGDEVVRIRGDETHPLTLGYLCAKGRSLGDAHASPNRLAGGHIGRGTERRAVDIDEAHADLGDVLRGIVSEHGLGAVGVFHGTGAFLDGLGSFTARRLKRELGTLHLYSTATIDAVAKTLVAEQMAGTPLLIPIVDEDVGRLLVFVGINPVVSHGHATMFSNPVARIRAAKRRGKVITLDPRTTETALLSDVHLAARPSTDFAVLAHTINRLIADGVDHSALDARATGFERLAAAVQPYDLDATAALTGLAPPQLDAFVDTVRDAGRLSILSGTGSTMSRTGNVTEWLAWALMVLTDSFDQPGGMWFNPGAFARLDRLDTLPHAAPTEPSPPSRPDVARCGGEWPAALIADEIEAGRLRALIVMGGNLVAALPDPVRQAAALSNIEALVVIDVEHNATTDLATHVFAAAGQLERSDVLPLELNANAVYQHLTDPVFEPRADRPPMWQILGRIAQDIGLDCLGGGLDPLTATTDQMLARMTRGESLERLRAAGGLLIDDGPVYGWVQSRLPFRRWNLAPDVLVSQLSEVGALGAPTSLTLTPRRRLKRMNSQRFADDGGNEVLIHAADAATAQVNSGDLVEITSVIGSLRLPARVTEGILPGTVSVLHGYADSNVNELLDRNDLDPLTGMVRLGGVPVTIRPVRPGAESRPHHNSSNY